MNRFERYLKVTNWARKRYERNGELIFARNGRPTAMARIEQAAAARYLPEMLPAAEAGVAFPSQPIATLIGRQDLVAWDQPNRMAISDPKLSEIFTFAIELKPWLSEK